MRLSLLAMVVIAGCTACQEWHQDACPETNLETIQVELNFGTFHDKVDETKFSPMNEILKDCKYNNEQAKAEAPAIVSRLRHYSIYADMPIAKISLYYNNDDKLSARVVEYGCIYILEKSDSIWILKELIGYCEEPE